MNLNRFKIILPNGSRLEQEKEEDKKRSRTRQDEDDNYIPVIIKRTDESVRHPDDTLEKAIHEGLEQHRRSKLSLYLSALTAGLILGFAAMSVALAAQFFNEYQNPLYQRIAMAVVYPLGFIVCVMSGTQLFTEHTATAVYPVLDNKAKVSSLLRLWLIVLIGNLSGTFITSLMMSSADNVIQARTGLEIIANHLLQYNFFEIFISAILAGWLMAQGSWLVHANPPGSSQIVCIYIVTFLIGLGGLHHSIAGSAEVFSALILSKNPQYLKSLIFLISAILGNLAGGSIFVAILNYAHIRKTQ